MRPEDSDQPHESHSIPALAIRYAHLTSVAFIAVVLFGILAVFRLPKDMLPSSNQPAVQVLTSYSGMPVTRVEKNLTGRIERNTGQAVGVIRQESRSLTGVSIVKNFFDSDSDINSAISQTSALVFSVMGRLPPGTQPPLIMPFDPMASMPIAIVSVAGNHTEKDLYDKARYNVRTSVQSVHGAIAPAVMGGSERQINILLNSKKLAKFNLSPLVVANKLDELNTFIPSGDAVINGQDIQILTNGIVDDIGEIDQFPLRADNGIEVKMRQVGHAEDSARLQTNIVTIDGKRQVYVPIYRQPGANTLEVVSDIRAVVQKLENQLGSFKLDVVSDQTVFIRSSIWAIVSEGLIGGGLAVLLVSFFLRNVRAAMTMSLAIPISLLFSFICLSITKDTINIMTLGGLALAIGVLIDDSIVVIENINKKLEHGVGLVQAAISGSAETALPVLASTLSIIVVLLPIFFMSGTVHILFGALSKAVIFAMVGSYVVSRTLVPLIAAHFFSKKSATEADNRLFRALLTGYNLLLEHAMRRRAFVVIGTFSILGLAIMLAPRLGTELFPNSDSGNFLLMVRLPSGTEITKSEQAASQIESQLKKWIPASDLKQVVCNIGVYYGFAAAYNPNSGPQDMFFDIQLSENRTRTSQGYAELIRREFPQFMPTAEASVQLGGLLKSALNAGLKAPLDVQVHGPDPIKTFELSRRLQNDMKQVRGIADVRIQQRFDYPIFFLNFNRIESARINLSIDEIVKNIVSGLNGSSTFRPSMWVDPRTGIDYQMGVQFEANQVTSEADLMQMPITGLRQERTVPLKSIATLERKSGPSEVSHVALEPVIDIFADAQSRDIGSLSREVRRIVAKQAWPSGYAADVRGEIKEMENCVSSLGGGILLSAFLVYLILTAQFRSFVLPAIIMVTVPIGGAGIILMFLATDTYFSIQAAIGSIFMVGIAVSNGVMLIDAINRQVMVGVGKAEAIRRGAESRLRPILMTSFASVFGVLPMALGLGHGSEANVPLGRAIIGGQILSTFVSIFLIPVLYSYLAGGSNKLGVTSIAEVDAPLEFPLRRASGE